MAAQPTVFIPALRDTSAKDEWNSLGRIAERRLPRIGVGRVVSAREGRGRPPCLMLDRRHPALHHMRIAVPCPPDHDRLAVLDDIARLATRLAGILDFFVIALKRLIGYDHERLLP